MSTNDNRNDPDDVPAFDPVMVDKMDHSIRTAKDANGGTLHGLLVIDGKVEGPFTTSTADGLTTSARDAVAVASAEAERHKPGEVFVDENGNYAMTSDGRQCERGDTAQRRARRTAPGAPWWFCFPYGPRDVSEDEARAWVLGAAPVPDDRPITVSVNGDTPVPLGSIDDGTGPIFMDRPLLEVATEEPGKPSAIEGNIGLVAVLPADDGGVSSQGALEVFYGVIDGEPMVLLKKPEAANGIGLSLPEAVGLAGFLDDLAARAHSNGQVTAEAISAYEARIEWVDATKTTWLKATPIPPPSLSSAGGSAPSESATPADSATTAASPSGEEGRAPGGPDDAERWLFGDSFDVDDSDRMQPGEMERALAFVTGKDSPEVAALRAELRKARGE